MLNIPPASRPLTVGMQVGEHPHVGEHFVGTPSVEDEDRRSQSREQSGPLEGLPSSRQPHDYETLSVS